MLTLTLIIICGIICISGLKGEGLVKKKYGFFNMLFDLIMTVLTCGGWLIWVLIRYLRTH